MAIQNIRGSTGLRGGQYHNLFVEGTNTTDGVLVMPPATALADLPSTVRAYAFQSTTPKYWDGTSWASFSGSGGYTTWDELYGNDKTLTIDSTTLTFALTHATNNGLTISGGASSAGHLLAFSNSYAGNDVYGTSGTWLVTSAGAPSFTGTLTLGGGSSDGTITSSGAYDLILETNTGTNSSKMTITDAANGAITFAMNGTGKVVISGTTETNTSFQVTNGDAVISDGSLTITDDDAAAALAVTSTGNSNIVTVVANSVTASHVMDLNGDGITSGYVLHIDSSNGASFSTGGYLEVNDGTSSCFTIKRYGATVIAGSASGTSALTLTAGDITVTDGQVSITRAGDNAVALTVTNDSATSASNIVFAGSGTFTGSTTTSFMTVTASGMTTGTAVYVPGAALTQGKLLHLTSGATQTTGSLLYVQDTGANSAITSGTIATFDLTSTALTSNTNKTGQGVAVTSSRTTTSATVSDNWDLLSAVRTDIINGAGSFTTAGSVLYVERAVTNTSGTVTDTVNGVEIVMDSLGTGKGIDLTHNAVAATAASITSVATTGIGLLVTQGTGVMTTGAVVRINSTGVSTGTGQGTLLDLVSSGAQTALICSLVTAALTTGKMFVMTGNALTTSGVGLDIGSTGTGMTTGSLLRVTSATTGAVATNGIVSLVASGAHTSTSNCGFVHISDATATGTAVDLSVTALTTGVGLYLANGTSAVTTGSLLRVAASGTGAVATNGVVSFQHAGVYTASTVGFVNVSASATTAGTVMTVTGAAVTDGTGLQISNASITTGKHFNVLGAAGASMFSIAVNGATTIAGSAGSTVLTVTAGDVSFADGSLAIADNDNAAATLSIANDTATSTGNAANLGVVDISCDGLTSGTALNISITDGTLTSGRYIKGWDVTRGAEDWAVIEDGVAYFAEGVATTAGGAHVMSFGTSQAIDIVVGSGAPTVAASQGSLYLRTDGGSTSTRLYVNTDGSTTWTSCTTAA